MNWIIRNIVRYYESFGGLSIAIIIFALLLIFTKPTIEQYSTIINELPTIGFGLFGFLLTLLSIILQGNSKTVNMMKENEVFYKKFVHFNKNIVILSLVVAILALLSSVLINMVTCLFINSIFISLLLSLSIWLICDTLYFIWIFYYLIEKP